MSVYYDSIEIPWRLVLFVNLHGMKKNFRIMRDGMNIEDDLLT